MHRTDCGLIKCTIYRSKFLTKLFWRKSAIADTIFSVGPAFPWEIKIESWDKKSNAHDTKNREMDTQRGRSDKGRSMAEQEDDDRYVKNHVRFDDEEDDLTSSCVCVRNVDKGKRREEEDEDGQTEVTRSSRSVPDVMEQSSHPILDAMMQSSHPILDAIKSHALRNKLKDRYRIVKHRVRDSSKTPSTDVIRVVSQTGGSKRALLIGINYKRTKYELKGCANDVTSMALLLQKEYGYCFDDMVMLLDTKKHELKATRANIVTWIKRMVAATKSGDELLVYYSGHGSQVKCTCGDEESNEDTPGMDDVIVPCDFKTAYVGESGLITDDELRAILVEPLPAGAKLRAFFDCCCSGTALDLPYVYKKDEKYVKCYDDKKITCTDCLLISGCRDDQTSADAYINGQFNGALSWGIQRVLEVTRNNKMNWKEFLLLLRIKLREAGYDQMPVLSVGCINVARSVVDI